MKMGEEGVLLFYTSVSNPFKVHQSIRVKSSERVRIGLVEFGGDLNKKLREMSSQFSYFCTFFPLWVTWVEFLENHFVLEG